MTLPFGIAGFSEDLNDFAAVHGLASQLQRDQLQC
jgi:hypothetical protein